MIRCDNGPEYISSAIQNWASKWGIRLAYIHPARQPPADYLCRAVQQDGPIRVVVTVLLARLGRGPRLCNGADVVLQP